MKRTTQGNVNTEKGERVKGRGRERREGEGHKTDNTGQEQRKA